MNVSTMVRLNQWESAVGRCLETIQEWAARTEIRSDAPNFSMSVCILNICIINPYLFVGKLCQTVWQTSFKCKSPFTVDLWSHRTWNLYQVHKELLFRWLKILCTAQVNMTNYLNDVSERVVCSVDFALLVALFVQQKLGNCYPLIWDSGKKQNI